MHELVKGFINYIGTIKGKTKSTCEAYEYDLSVFANWVYETHKITLSKDSITKVKLETLYEFMGHLKNNGCGEYGRSRMTSSIKSFFRYTTNKAKAMSKDPSLELEKPKLPQRIPKYLSREEASRFLDAIKDVSTKSIVTVFLNTGMRISELVSINLEDVTENSIRIVGKGNKERVVYLNQASKSAINDYIAKRPKSEDPALFLGKDKKRITNECIAKRITRLAEKLGMDGITPHKFRSTFATILFQNGTDIRILQKLLGHADISTTTIYTNAAEKQLENVVNELNIMGN